jgi:hypothetical protein
MGFLLPEATVQMKDELFTHFATGNGLDSGTEIQDGSIQIAGAPFYFIRSLLAPTINTQLSTSSLNASRLSQMICHFTSLTFNTSSP